MPDRTAADPALLVERAANGDEGALGALYDLFAPSLYGFALRRLGDRDLAEQLVQDVMTSVWRQSGRYDPQRAGVRTWVFQIARSRVVDLHRGRARRPPGPLATEPDPAEGAPGGAPLDPSTMVGDPIGELDRLLSAGLVHAALDRLGSEHREVIELAYLRGLRQSEIATRLGLPVGTVKSRTHYALRAFGLACDELGLER
ncbi:MAG: sigma-70 family RNA polymerase sigma factor [Nitriliruptoraceae bacterium]